MNFEFIKNLEGLNKAFDSCSNAEELAKSMPDLSMVASRKSAEVIAKFVYLIAHNEQVEELTFADVLSDYAVKRYLGSRDILDAFHYIRKSGNTAVHTLTQESPDSAIAVLKQLHFVVGEVARRMKLIRSYPRFDPNLSAVPGAVFLNTEDTGKLAREMYADYAVSKALAVPIVIVPGDVDLNERIEFDHKPALDSTIAKIQEHFGFLALQAMRCLQEDAVERELDFKAEITLLGKDGYTASDLVGFMGALMYDLPNADGFRITTAYYGPSVAPWTNSEAPELFSKTVEKMGAHEKFTYSAFEFFYNHGEGRCLRYENGKWSDLEKEYLPALLDRDYGKDWRCWNQDLYVEFDFEKHADILEALHSAVRKYVPEDQVGYCEDSWEDGDSQILCSSIDWEPRKLRVVQDFLDEVNRILEPIKSECECSGEGNWYITEAPFAIATWDWIDGGFKIIGVEL